MSRQVLTVAADGTGDCRTVAQAVARARTGAVVSIAPGRYEESVTVAVSITLSAAEGRGTVELAPRRGPALTSPRSASGGYTYTYNAQSGTTSTDGNGLGHDQLVARHAALAG